jgi:pantoate--beta-alanine ligase
MSSPRCTDTRAPARELRVVRTVAELRSELAPARREGLRIGLVPTMGALHAGHISLVERARETCDMVVVSLFVNPTQFDDASDLARYPREERRDAELAARAGADLLFAPAVDAVYPPGFATTVEVAGLTERLEGAARGASHFRGVATVVTKLLCMTLPDSAFFGEKDAQQVLVIRRLVADLDLPVEIVTAPTVREADGLALSSRNARLSADERERALALPAALHAAQALVAAGERSAGALLQSAREAMRARGVEPEYIELADPRTLEPRAQLDADALLLIAARIGTTRLIDNVTLSPATDHAGARAAGRKELVTCSE